MRRFLVACVMAAVCSWAASAQQAVPPAEAAPDPRRDTFPNLNLYLPEGEIDIRVRKLIRNVLFEGQVDYKFVEGDVSTFLRYKYYASNFTYKIGVFDNLEFSSVDERSGDFDRVRGGLVLFEYPVDYNHRYFLLTQTDRLSFGDTDRPENNKTNNYIKAGVQYGTPFDERLNRIVGESRGRITPVLTAYREIGPQKLGLAFGVTQSVDAGGGDYQYTRVEAEALKRFDVSSKSFLISRLHVGSFVQKEDREADPDAPDYEHYQVPRYEFFKLGGREALKGVDDNQRGTDEIHLSNEYFYPVFRNKEYKVGPTRWNNMYAIGYLGAGALGFDSSIFTDFGDYVFDAGLGFESTLTVRNYEVFLTVVYAQTVRAPEDLEGDEIRFSVRTSR